MTAQWVFPVVRALLPITVPSLAIFVIGFVAVQWVFDLTYGLIWIALTWLLIKYVPLSVAVFIIAAVFLWMVVKW